MRLKVLRETLKRKPDIVLSDLAANTTGHRQTDHLKTVALVESAADFAMEVLKPGGSFVTKVFQGGAEEKLLAMLKKSFKTVKHAKPKSSRAGKPRNVFSC
jgi:23S rRNA (uridine2552-2'-O)-methyltransferase